MADPDSDDLEAIHRLIERAGNKKELSRWIRQAKGRRRGRPPGASRHAEYDDEVLFLAQLMQAAALQRGEEEPLGEILKKLLTHTPRPDQIESDAAERAIAHRWTKERGTTIEATVRRMLDKDAKQQANREGLSELGRRELLDWIDGLDKDGPNFKILELACGPDFQRLIRTILS